MVEVWKTTARLCWEDWEGPFDALHCLSEYRSLWLSKIGNLISRQNASSNFIQGAQYPAFGLPYYLEQNGANQLITSLVKNNHYQCFTHHNISFDHIASLDELTANQMVKLCQMFVQKQQLALKTAPKPKVVSKHTGTLNSPVTIASQSLAKRWPARSLPKAGSRPHQPAPKPVRQPTPTLSFYPSAWPPPSKKTPRLLPNSPLQSSPRTAVIANRTVQQQATKYNNATEFDSDDADKDYNSSKDSDSSSLSEEDSPAEDAPAESLSHTIPERWWVEDSDSSSLSEEDSQVSPTQYQNVDELRNQIEEEQHDKENKSGNNMLLAEIKIANNKSNDIEAPNKENEDKSGMNMLLAEIEAANNKSNVLEAVNDKNKNESNDILDTPGPTKEYPR
jgi:hypothetical protein